jgi:hypothetical protein
MSGIHNTPNAFFFTYLYHFLPWEINSGIRNDGIDDGYAFRGFCGLFVSGIIPSSIFVRKSERFDVIAELSYDLVGCGWESEFDFRNGWVGRGVAEVAGCLMDGIISRVDYQRVSSSSNT